ncbi:hypothetical protein [Nocardiopsis sp. LOL_012]|uniref:hypothetical protein n=1 Tax=Nocardiopsis sp. LOL_012 TaxID=3345409 RepID=UPI003A88A1AC
MHAENTTITRDNTVAAYRELDYTETALDVSTETLASPNPFQDSNRPADIRAWFADRDAHRNAVVEAARQTGLFAQECADAGLDLAEEVARFTDREPVVCAPARRVVPEFWPPREGDVWATRQGWTWTLQAGEMAAESPDGPLVRVSVEWLRGEEPVLVSRAGSVFVWLPVLRRRFPVGARVVHVSGREVVVGEAPVGERCSGVVGAWWLSAGVWEMCGVWVVPVGGGSLGVWVPVGHVL